MLTTSFHTANELVPYFRLPSVLDQLCNWGDLYLYTTGVQTVHNIVDWFAGRSGKTAMNGISNRLNYCANIYSVYVIYERGRGPHNTTWRTASWSPTLYKIVQQTWLVTVCVSFPRWCHVNRYCACIGHIKITTLCPKMCRLKGRDVNNVTVVMRESGDNMKLCKGLTLWPWSWTFTV